MILRQIIREIINVMVSDVVKNVKINLKKYNPKNVNDIYKSNISYVKFSEELLNFDYHIRDFLKYKMYNNQGY